MALLVFYITLALGVSFLCSILEAVLLSVTPSFVAKLEDTRPGVGARLRSLKLDIDKPLAAILSLNTVAHTIGAAGAGAQALEVFGNEWVSVMSAILTLLILIVSEIIPKTLGAVYWKGLAPSVAYLLPPLITITYPLVVLSQWFSSLVASKEKGPTLDREEFSALAQLLVKEGVFGTEESSVLTNLLRFGSLEGQHIMTPRTVMIGFPEETTVAAAIAQREKMIFSRFPVWAETDDHVTGLVLKHDLLFAMVQGEGEKSLAELRRDILNIRASEKVSILMNRMLADQHHMALLVGEFGGTAGIVTLEDIVETLLGMEIVDEIDEVDDMQKLARKVWEDRARQRGVRLGDEEAAAPAEEAASEEEAALEEETTADPAKAGDGEAAAS